MSSMGDPAFDNKHRNLTIQKCENGYTVDAAYSKKVARGEEQWDTVERKRRVFYSLEEVVQFVSVYLSAKPEDLVA